MSQAVAAPAQNPNHELLTLDEIGDALRAKFPLPAKGWFQADSNGELLELCAKIDG